MKELFIINQVMSTFKLQTPIIQKVQKKIYQSKKRTFNKIMKSIMGSNSGANDSTEFHLRAKKIFIFIPEDP